MKKDNSSWSRPSLSSGTLDYLKGIRKNYSKDKHAYIEEPETRKLKWFWRKILYGFLYPELNHKVMYIDGKLTPNPQNIPVGEFRMYGLRYRNNFFGFMLRFNCGKGTVRYD